MGKHLPARKASWFRGPPGWQGQRGQRRQDSPGCFLDGVVLGVPVQAEWPVVEIDDVNGGDAKFEKWQVVVLDGPRAIQEVAAPELRDEGVVGLKD